MRERFGSDLLGNEPDSRDGSVGRMAKTCLLYGKRGETPEEIDETITSCGCDDALAGGANR